MLIQEGYQKKKVFGFHVKPNVPDFHSTFGSTVLVPPDFNLDSGLSNFDQNIPNPIFGTPAQPEGCGGMTDADICSDTDKILYSPWFSHEKNCYLANVSTDSPVDETDILNSPIVYGVLAEGESTDQQALAHRRGQWFGVSPLNGSLFQGIISAMHTGQGSVSFFSDWYESFETPSKGIVPSPSGNTSGHNWKFCGVITVEGRTYLIAKPWLGISWGEGGFCYISEFIVNSLDADAFIMVKASAVNAPIVRYTLMQTLVNYLNRAVILETELKNTMTQTMVQKWAQAIQKEEGASPASNNPGNLKYSTLTASWGATEGRPATDGGFLCQFPTEASGMAALVNFLALGCEDELKAFHQARTLREFTVVYAGNPPEGYIEGVITALGVSGDTLISTFI